MAARNIRNPKIILKSIYMPLKLLFTFVLFPDTCRWQREGREAPCSGGFFSTCVRRRSVNCSIPFSPFIAFFYVVQSLARYSPGILLDGACWGLFSLHASKPRLMLLRHIRGGYALNKESYGHNATYKNRFLWFYSSIFSFFAADKVSYLAAILESFSAFAVFLQDFLSSVMMFYYSHLYILTNKKRSANAPC